MTHEDIRESYLMGFFRWRGSLNWKDITERAIAAAIGGTFAGFVAGMVVWGLTKVFGG